jgi:hypothetical protein
MYSMGTRRGGGRGVFLDVGFDAPTNGREREARLTKQGDPHTCNAIQT